MKKTIRFCIAVFTLGFFIPFSGQAQSENEIGFSLFSIQSSPFDIATNHLFQFHFLNGVVYKRAVSKHNYIRASAYSIRFGGEIHEKPNVYDGLNGISMSYNGLSFKAGSEHRFGNGKVLPIVAADATIDLGKYYGDLQGGESGRHWIDHSKYFSVGGELSMGFDFRVSPLISLSFESGLDVGWAFSKGNNQDVKHLNTPNTQWEDNGLNGYISPLQTVCFNLHF